MKNHIIHTLQSILGFKRYLFLFSIFTYYKLRWDRKERDFLKLIQLIKEDGIILDIGANIGVMTTHLAKNFKGSTIYSFEPIPANYEVLNRICKHFNTTNTKIFNLALSNASGTLEMIMPVINGTKKHGLCHVKTGNEKETYKEWIDFNVEITTLDNFMTKAKVTQKITAIKIDVEGHELNVLKGAKNIIQDNQPIIYCELWEGEQRNETIEFMKTLNYKTMVLEKSNLTDFTNQSTQNFFFLPA